MLIFFLSFSLLFPPLPARQQKKKKVVEEESEEEEEETSEEEESEEEEDDSDEPANEKKLVSSKSHVAGGRAKSEVKKTWFGSSDQLLIEVSIPSINVKPGSSFDVHGKKVPVVKYFGYQPKTLTHQ